MSKSRIHLQRRPVWFVSGSSRLQPPACRTSAEKNSKRRGWWRGPGEIPLLSWVFFLALGDARSRCSTPAIPSPPVPPPLGSSPLPGQPRSLRRGLLQKYRSGLAEVGEEMSEHESSSRQSQDHEDGLSRPQGAQGPAVERVNGKGRGLQHPAPSTNLAVNPLQPPHRSKQGAAEGLRMGM